MLKSLKKKRNRNILEIHLTRISSTDDNNPSKSKKSLTFDDLGELIFDVLKIKVDECISFDYNTGRYDSKQIKFKPGVSLDNYVFTSPIIFKDHEITTKKQLNNITRVTFKNVPLNVPNEEIINLCLCYGKPVENHVYHEVLMNAKNKGHTGSTRYVDMEFVKGMSMENYYWLEGPLQGDQGRRVLVLHSGQTPQCSNCLKKGNSGCPAQGNGKICTEMKTPRAKMNNYMNSLKIKVLYSSLKTQYMEQQARNFPSLLGSDTVSSNMEEEFDGEEAIFPMNPIESKDKEIASLQKQLCDLKTCVSETDKLKEDLSKSSADLAIAQKNFQISQKKLDFTKKATEKRLVDSITNPEGYRADNILIGVYSATLDEDEFVFDETSELSAESRSRKDLFLSLKDKLDLDNPDQNDRFKEVTNQILEKVKHTKHSRFRSSSVSSKGKCGRS